MGWGNQVYRVLLLLLLLLLCYHLEHGPDGRKKKMEGGRTLERNSYLVDPASSHMLVSKIKPCMCKYKLFCTVKLRMAH